MKFNVNDKVRYCGSVERLKNKKGVITYYYTYMCGKHWYGVKFDDETWWLSEKDIKPVMTNREWLNSLNDEELSRIYTTGIILKRIDGSKPDKPYVILTLIYEYLKINNFGWKEMMEWLSAEQLYEIAGNND